MSKKKSNGANGTSGKRKRRPFLERFTARVEKTKAWIESSAKRFADAPKADVADSLTAMGDSIDAIIEALPELKGWQPKATRGVVFAVGDSVSFKPKKVAELVEKGFYKKTDLEGEHEIVAVNGRKVKLPLGVFQTMYVQKSAEA